MNAIKNLVNKPTETFELQHIPDKFKSNDYQSKLETIINIINSPHIENYLQKIELFINIDENKKYLYKNMVLFLFTLNSEKLLIKKLFNGQNFKIYINKINNNPHKLFLKHINIKNLKKNNWNDKVKNLIYRFHLTNIISVLLILTKNLSDLESEDQYYKSLKEKVMENIEDIENFSEQKEIEKLINYSEENVDFLIVINDKLCRLLSDIFNVKEKEKHQILQGYDTTKKNLVDIMEHFNSF